MAGFIGGSPIKSIQSGTATTTPNGTTNITISSVNTAKAFVIITGPSFGTSQLNFYTQLTSSINLAVTINASVTLTFSWQVIEYV